MTISAQWDKTSEGLVLDTDALQQLLGNPAYSFLYALSDGCCLELETAMQSDATCWLLYQALRCEHIESPTDGELAELYLALTTWHHAKQLWNEQVIRCDLHELDSLPDKPPLPTIATKALEQMYAHHNAEYKQLYNELYFSPDDHSELTAYLKENETE